MFTGMPMKYQEIVKAAASSENVMLNILGRKINAVDGNCQLGQINCSGTLQSNLMGVVMVY
jgi:hypothetical protein